MHVREQHVAARFDRTREHAAWNFVFEERRRRKRTLVEKNVKALPKLGKHRGSRGATACPRACAWAGREPRGAEAKARSTDESLREEDRTLHCRLAQAVARRAQYVA